MKEERNLPVAAAIVERQKTKGKEEFNRMGRDVGIRGKRAGAGQYRQLIDIL